jgi:hypothetical protein
VPIAYRVDHEARVIVAAAYGTLTDEEMFDYQKQGFKMDEAAGYDELVDLTHVKEIALPSTERVRELADRAAGMDVKLGGSKLAVVAPGDLAFALGRMFQTIRELDPRSTTAVGVFRSTDEALAFLGVDHPLALPILD